MTHDHDPFATAAYPSIHVRYAIHSARAVVQALIARDRAAAEEAALRTCHDCELLIRLIRDLVLLIGDPLNQQQGLSPLDAAALARRADQVLALVDSQGAVAPSPTQQNRSSEDEVVQRRKPDGRSSEQLTPSGALKSSPRASQGTVASTGLRVRLVLADGTSPPTPADDSQNDGPKVPSGEQPCDIDKP
jgi:hypothetical protein